MRLWKILGTIIYWYHQNKSMFRSVVIAGISGTHARVLAGARMFKHGGKWGPRRTYSIPSVSRESWHLRSSCATTGRWLSRILGSDWLDLIIQLVCNSMEFGRVLEKIDLTLATKTTKFVYTIWRCLSRFKAYHVFPICHDNLQELIKTNNSTKECDNYSTAWQSYQ